MRLGECRSYVLLVTPPQDLDVTLTDVTFFNNSATHGGGGECYQCNSIRATRYGIACDVVKLKREWSVAVATHQCTR